MRIQGYDGRCTWQQSRGFYHFVIVQRTDVAETLSQNNIGGRVDESLFIDGVEAFTGGKQFANFAVDLATSHSIGIDAAANDNPLLFCIVRIIALMGDADDLVA